jgi:hypothetical protein
MRRPFSNLWPKTAPSIAKLHLTRQVRYFIAEDASVKRKGLIDVWEYNTLSKSGNRDQKHWKWFPAVYTDHVKLIIYRFDLYLHCLDVASAQRLCDDKDVISELKKYIGYYERVMDTFWEEARIADVNDVLTAAWRSPALDEWLVKEYVVRRHDQISVETFLATLDTSNGEAFQEDAMELGVSILSA